MAKYNDTFVNGILNVYNKITLSRFHLSIVSYENNTLIFGDPRISTKLMGANVNIEAIKNNSYPTGTGNFGLLVPNKYEAEVGNYILECIKSYEKLISKIGNTLNYNYAEFIDGDNGDYDRKVGFINANNGYRFGESIEASTGNYTCSSNNYTLNVGGEYNLSANKLALNGVKSASLESSEGPLYLSSYKNLSISAGDQGIDSDILIDASNNIDMIGRGGYKLEAYLYEKKIHTDYTKTIMDGDATENYGGNYSRTVGESAEKPANVTDTVYGVYTGTFGSTYTLTSTGALTLYSKASAVLKSNGDITIQANADATTILSSNKIYMKGGAIVLDSGTNHDGYTYGTSNPNTTGAKEGQIYFKIIS